MPAVGVAVADKVAACWVHSNEVAYSWFASMLELIGYDAAGPRLLEGGWFGVRFHTGGIGESRNVGVVQFLDQSDADWLWWVDTDMGFEADTLHRLHKTADKDERPVVGALCFSQNEVGSDGMNGHLTVARPVIMDWVKLPDGRKGFAGRQSYEPNSLVACQGVGSACVLVHRSVLERVREMAGDNWYSPIQVDGTWQSEDLSFCIRLGAAGVPVHVDTAVKTSHMKTQWVSDIHFAGES